MHAIYIGSTLLILASILAFPVFKVSVARTFQLQLVLVCVADIYASGLALGFTCVFAAMSGPLVIPKQALLAWGVWAIAMICAIWNNGYTLRMLFQVVEMFYYLAIIVLAASLAERAGGRRRILWGLTLGGLLLALTFLAMPLLYSGSWSAGLRGRNEGSLVLVFAGIIAPLTLSFWATRRTKLLLFTVSISSVAATFVAESRASSLLGCAILVAVAFVHVFGLSAMRFAMSGIVLAGLAMQSPVVHERLDRLFDTERNFSNIERLAMIETCLDLFYEKPLTGWGWGSLEGLLPRRSHTRLDYPHPHNTYVHFAAELGTLGLIGLSILYGSVGSVALGNYASNRVHETVFVALSGSAIVALGFVEDYFYGGSRGVIVAVVLGVIFSYGRRSKKAIASHPVTMKMPRQPLRNQHPATI